MAYFCPDCKIIFKKRVANCPHCGFGIATDNQPDSFYLNQGFSVANYPHHCTDTDSVKIHDDDILKKIRGRYTEFINEEPTHTPSSIQPESYEQPQQNPPKNDFFASFDGNEVRTPEIIIEPESEPDPDSVNIPVPRFEERPHTNNYYTPRRRHFSSFNIRPAQIPWRAIMLLAIFVAVIAIIAIIWSMRFTILESILNFITTLLPAAIIIGIIAYLIRKLFRS